MLTYLEALEEENPYALKLIAEDNREEFADVLVRLPLRIRGNILNAMETAVLEHDGPHGEWWEGYFCGLIEGIAQDDKWSQDMLELYDLFNRL